MVFSRQFQGLVPSEKSGELWDRNKHEFVVSPSAAAGPSNYATATCAFTTGYELLRHS